MSERRQRLSLIWGSWTILGFFFSTQVFVATQRLEQPIPFYQILFLEMAYAYLWALLTPLVFVLARRYPITAGSALWGRFLMHVGFGALFGFFTRGMHDLPYRYLILGDEFSIFGFLRSVFFLVDYGIWIYWLLLLIEYSAEYYRRMRAEELKTSKLETQLAQAQLNALKMQLQPHFLFNTLNSISALLHQDAEAADRMIARLGELLRSTLDNSRTQEVTLEKEVDYLRCYLGIEEIRFQERLSVEIKIDPAARKAKVPNLLLQPIVENAIKHGISKQLKPGLIRIKAEPRGDKLWIHVEDNGPGITFDETSGIVVKQGFGLSSTQERLTQRYGENKFNFNISSAPNGGFVVDFELPLEK